MKPVNTNAAANPAPPSDQLFWAGRYFCHALHVFYAPGSIITVPPKGSRRPPFYVAESTQVKSPESSVPKSMGSGHGTLRQQLITTDANLDGKPAVIW